MGNPGNRYAQSRHNAGFLVIDRIAEIKKITLRKPWFKAYLYGEGDDQGVRLCLSKPLTYMNRSGEVVQSIFKLSGLKKENLLVICDTLDLPVGALRLKARGAAGGHNGLKSLADHLRDGNFMRLYVGIGRPDGGRDVVSHVLGDPSDEEKKLLEKSYELAADAVLALLRTTPESVMNEINRKQ